MIKKPVSYLFWNTFSDCRLLPSFTQSFLWIVLQYLTNLLMFKQTWNFWCVNESKPAWVLVELPSVPLQSDGSELRLFGQLGRLI